MEESPAISLTGFLMSMRCIFAPVSGEWEVVDVIPRQSHKPSLARINVEGACLWRLINVAPLSAKMIFKVGQML